jgi:hypothetical protein
LPRSLSEANLECLDSEERVNDIWQAHLDELERCRQEQVNIRLTSFTILNHSGNFVRKFFYR